MKLHKAGDDVVVWAIGDIAEMRCMSLIIFGAIFRDRKREISCRDPLPPRKPHFQRPEPEEQGPIRVLLIC